MSARSAKERATPHSYAGRTSSTKSLLNFGQPYGIMLLVLRPAIFVHGAWADQLG